MKNIFWTTPSSKNTMTKSFPTGELEFLLKIQDSINTIYSSGSVKISYDSIPAENDFIIVLLEYKTPNVLFSFAQQYEALKRFYFNTSKEV